jgi:hypothetical protein
MPAVKTPAEASLAVVGMAPSTIRRYEAFEWTASAIWTAESPAAAISVEWKRKSTISNNTSLASTGKSVEIRFRNDTEHPEHDAPCSQITGVVRNGNGELRTLRRGPIMPGMAQAATIGRDDAPRIERKLRRDISISLAP